MTWNLVAHTHAVGNALVSPTTPSVDTTGADLIIVAVTYNPSGTMSDSKSNTWTEIGPAGPAGGQQSGALFYSHNPTVGTGHTFSYTGGYVSMEVQAWSGSTSSATVLDQDNFSATATPGSITPTQNNELVVTSCNTDFGSLTAPSPYTVSDNDPDSGATNYGGAFAYNIQTTAAATNPAWTSGGDSNSMVASFFAPASGAGLTPFVEAWL